jgi:hypothetical protein
MVSPGRFELPTYGLGNRCSIQLSYGDPTVYVSSLPQDRLLPAHEAQWVNVLGSQDVPANVTVGRSLRSRSAQGHSGAAFWTHATRHVPRGLVLQYRMDFQTDKLHPAIEGLQFDQKCQGIEVAPE